ncbi:MAG: tetratricopeptide repeat protein [Anaerolineales bacterium]|nr:tetratricopeptide repeat protein [Anaerolineales bacterium]
MFPAATTYIPRDRRHALAHGTVLPNRTVGSALFADVSGFTPLTEALAKELGPQRGAEELTKLLNTLYGGLIAEVDLRGGSVIVFGGDAITCWFADDSGPRAADCALAMQQVLRQYSRITTPAGTSFELAIKVAVAAGPARRFRTGDPRIQYLDVLAGRTLERLANAEHAAGRGEVVVSAEVVDERLVVSEWRAGAAGERFAVVTGLTQPVALTPWPELPGEALAEAQVRPWLLPATYERLKTGQDKFDAELRPTVALFLSFEGIDYDQDEDAGEKLDRFVGWVQGILERYEGTLLQLTMGDKGSYLYAAFGAPLAHEDDAARAALAALELRQRPAELSFITAVRIGVSQGRMRVGPYGGPTRRTYGVLGDHVNLAARLMQSAPAGEALVSQAAQKDAAAGFEWDAWPALRVKGKSEPVVVFRLAGRRAQRSLRLQEPRYTLPMVGRAAELALAEAKLAQTVAGHGQIVAVTAEAGMGKSRLTAEIVRRATSQHLTVYAGECQSFGTNHSYLVWQTIWRDFFGLDAAWPVDEQLRQVEAYLAAIDPALARRLPLLDTVLNLPIPDNDLTAALDAKLRKGSLEALLVDCLRARAQAGPLALVLEDCHWLDPLSHDLLEALGRITASLPVLILIAYRPPTLEHLQDSRVTALPHATVIPLFEFSPVEAGQLIALKLAQTEGGAQHPPARLVQRIVERSQGNPFYIEELLNYLRDRGLDYRDLAALENLELPTSLQSLILSRIDQLAESQKITLKVASIIGRLFREAWLAGVDPQLDVRQVKHDLARLNELDLTPLDQPEPEHTYLFKHIVTREVAYESLPFDTRALLHEQLARYLEYVYADQLPQYVELLAYHYGLSHNAPKQREYWRLAGEAAQAAFANVPALDYYRRLLPLLSEAERGPILLRLGQILELVGEWPDAEAHYRQALDLADRLDSAPLRVGAQTGLGGLARKQGDYTPAVAWLERARAGFAELGDHAGICRVMAEIGELYRLKGDYAEAQARYQDSLTLAEQVHDPAARRAARASILKSAGTLANQQGNPTRARELYEESLALRRELNDKYGAAILLNNLGVVAMYQEDYPTSRPLYTESLALLREIGDRWAVGQILNNLGLVLRYQGDYAEARAQLEESVAVRRALGDKWGIANALSSLTNLLIHLGQFDGVRGMLEESLRLNLELGDRTAIAYCLEDFASLAAAHQQPERALRLAGAAAALRAAIGGPLPTGEQTLLDHTLEPARAGLSPETAAAYWQAGLALSLETATAEALGA